MFDGIVAAKRHCDHCGKLRLVAFIPHDRDARPFETAEGDPPLTLCGECISGLQRLTYYLRRLEAEPPKKPRKRARGQPKPDAAYSGPDKHTVGSLVPAEGDHSS